MKLIDADSLILNLTFSEQTAKWNVEELRAVLQIVNEMPTVESGAQSIGKCETCYYWGNRIMMRDGSLGDCGNFGVSLSKDFFCAWWSQKEKKGEEDV